MKPIAQTITAARQLSMGAGVDLLGDIQFMADQVQDLVPDCVGMSIAWHEQGVTFTLEATDEETAVLDAIQYIHHGPCVQGVQDAQGLEASSSDLMDEARWRLFALATAAHGIRSTLTLPLTRDTAVVGSVNLYGASDNAFEGHHEQLAHALGASAAGAVRNADLAFATRALAHQAPTRVHDNHMINVASGVVAATLGIATSLARQRLIDAARRGISSERFAQALLSLND